MLRKILHLLRALFILFAVIYGMIVLLLSVPPIQKQLTKLAEHILEEKLSTDVGIGGIEYVYPNRLILKEVTLNDLDGEQILRASRLSAKMELFPLLKGKIVIHTVQLFGFDVNIYQKEKDTPTNIQFLIDTFAQQESSSSQSIDLRINSLLIRHGKVKYNVLSEPETPGKFNPAHINLNNFQASVSLKALRADSINTNIKRFECKEYSGIDIKSLTFLFLAGKQQALLSDFVLKLPDSNLKIDSIVANYLFSPETAIDSVRISGMVNPNSYITLKDLSPLVPTFAHFRMPLYLNTSFNVSPGIIEVPTFTVNSAQNDVNISIHDFRMESQNDSLSFLHASLQQATLSSQGIQNLYNNLISSEGEVPQMVKNVGNLRIQGTIDGTPEKLKFNTLLSSGIGKANANATLNITNPTHIVYSGSTNSKEIDFKQLLGAEQNLGKTSFNIQFNGSFRNSESPSVYLKGLFPTIQYSDYAYQNIRLNGTLHRNLFDGMLAIDDPNAAVVIDGKFDLSRRIPVFNAKAKVKHLRPYDLKLTETRQNYEYNFNLSGDFSGNNINNIVGKIDVDSLSVILPDDYYFMDNLHVNAEILDAKRKRITIDSDFMQALIEGEYAYQTLMNSFTSITKRHLPSLTKSIKKESSEFDNNFTFALCLSDSKFYPYVLGIPLNVLNPITLNGRINDATQILDFKGNAAAFTYDNETYESVMLSCSSDTSSIKTQLRLIKEMDKESNISLALDSEGKNDSLHTHIFWGNDEKITYCGTLDADIAFHRDSPTSPYLSSAIRINPSELILADTIWNIKESTIQIDSGFVNISDFRIESQNKHLAIQGLLSDRTSDSLIIDLKHIDVEYILNIVNFDDVSFTGDATGKVHVRGALGKSPIANTHLNVDNFHFNGGFMGDMDIYGVWDDKQGVLLDADIRETDISRTRVTGFINPMEKGLDLNIYPERTNLEFLNSFVGSVFSNVQGRTSGYVRLHGPFKKLNLEGKAHAEAQAHVDVLGIDITIPGDSIYLTPSSIDFNNVKVNDKHGNQLYANGRLTHTNLKNMDYNFNFELENFLFYDFDDFGDMPFYGTLIGSGSIWLWNGENDININGNISTSPNTLFVYNLSTPEAITDSRFITFVDRTPRPAVNKRRLRLFRSTYDIEEKQENSTPLNLNLNAGINITPSATVRVIMDSKSGDFVSAMGSGDIHINLTGGAADLRGTYTIESGQYKMSIQDVIRKDFQIQQGSEVTFSGDEANLNVKAVHTVSAVSLNDLVPDATFNQNSVRVNCIINMTGQLASPSLSFDLELPTVNEEERQLVRSAISTDEQMRMQIIYLLGVGKFYTYDYANTEERSSSDAMSSILSSTLSGQLNNIISQAIDMRGWNFSSNFTTGEEGWSDLEVEGILSGSLLNNRLLINGAFGYKENQLSNSNFVGDFNLQWLLTPSGELRLKAYNQTNDRYFAKTTFNTQGIGFIYKREFDNWREFFRIRKKKSKR